MLWCTAVTSLRAFFHLADLNDSGKQILLRKQAFEGYLKFQTNLTTQKNKCILMT